jgi:hypothetical protein
MSPASRTRKELLTTDEFVMLSAELGYQLWAKHFNERALMSLMLGGLPPSGGYEYLVWAIRVLRIGYGDSTRRMGTPAILHPLRVTAILARFMREPSTLDLLAAMLHDRDEDCTRDSMDEEVDPGRWDRFQEANARLFATIDTNQQWYLGERIALLTRKEHESYNSYLCNIFAKAPEMPDLVRVKATDRWDNTLDSTITRPGLMRYNFFRTVFDALFVPSFRGVDVE